MGKLNLIQVTKTTRSREDRFRRAQHQAFEKVARTSDSAQRRENMSRAVEDIIEACESYLDFGFALDRTA